MKYKLMRISKVVELTGLSKTTIYLHISQGTFPRQIQLGKRSVAWIESEIEDWIEERMNNRDIMP